MRFPQVGVVILALLVSACNNRDPELDEEYTISGHLYEGSGESPLANQAVYLEGFRRKGFGGSGEFTNLGSTVTDSGGYFSITYDQQFASFPELGSGAYVELRTSELTGGSVMSFPWNIDLARDFSTLSYSTLTVIAKFKGTVSDSFYVMLPFVFGDSQAVSIAAPEILEGQTYSAIAVPVEGSSVIIECNLAIGGTWDNTPQRYYYSFGRSYKDMHRATIANFVDSIPDFYNSGELFLRGFPKEDTLKIQIP